MRWQELVVMRDASLNVRGAMQVLPDEERPTVFVRGCNSAWRLKGSCQGNENIQHMQGGGENPGLHARIKERGRSSSL